MQELFAFRLGCGILPGKGMQGFNMKLAHEQAAAKSAFGVGGFAGGLGQLQGGTLFGGHF